MQKLFFTTKELARFLQLAPGTLSEMRVTGKGPRYYKVGPGIRSAVRYSLTDVNTWLEQRHVKSTAQHQYGDASPKV